MKDSTLEKLLKDHAFAMCERWDWLTIKVGYDEDKGAYLVSYGPREVINSHNDFLQCSMLFEDFMDALYGDNAPLFCDDEKYFTIKEQWLIVQKKWDVELIEEERI